MSYNVLTDFQAKVLLGLFEKGLGREGYYLTGGTALAEFYLDHRYSDDLDLFTRKTEGFATDFSKFRDIFTSMGYTISSQLTQPEFARFHIEREGIQEEPLKVEFARHEAVQIAEPLIRGNIVVDSFEDISVNKICAILKRMPHEIKDYVDLYFILRNSQFSLDYLLSRAREKNATFDDEYGSLIFAGNPLEVSKFQNLPRMKKARLKKERSQEASSAGDKRV